MKQLFLTQTAFNDIQEIWSYIALDSLEAADRVRNQIELELLKLCEFPRMGHKRADVSNPNFRFWRVHAYVIAYRLKGSKLIVSKVFHGSRNISNVFRWRR